MKLNDLFPLLLLIYLIFVSILCRKDNPPVYKSILPIMKNEEFIRYRRYVIGEHFKFTGLIAGEIVVQQQDEEFYIVQYWFTHERDSTKWTAMKYFIDMNKSDSSNLELIDSQTQKVALKFINEKDYSIDGNKFKILKFTSGTEEEENYLVHFWSQNFGLIMVCSSDSKKYFEVAFVEDMNKDDITTKLIDNIKRDSSFYPLETGPPIFDPN